MSRSFLSGVQRRSYTDARDGYPIGEVCFDPGQAARTYAAMMSAMDDAVGAIVDKLRQLKLEDNTLVFFISDNGGPSMNGTTKNGSDNSPLRGSKRTTLEGGIRVPFFIKWPRELPAGKVYDQPVIQLDILPTALAAAGAAATDDANIDGVNLLPYLSGENDGEPHEALYWRFGQQMAIRKGDWKLVQYDLRRWHVRDSNGAQALQSGERYR